MAIRKLLASMLPLLFIAAGWLLLWRVSLIWSIGEALVATAGVVLLVLAFLISWFLMRANDPPESAPPSAEAERVASAQVALLRDLLEVRDLSTSVTLTSRIDRALQSAGVETVTASPSSSFDEGAQHAIGVVTTLDPALDDRVAETINAGYRLDGRLLRPPDVTVYRRQEDSSAGSDATSIGSQASDDG